MSAVFREYHEWESAPALKLLLPQRDEQFKRSDAARNNRIVKPTGRPYLSNSLPRREARNQQVSVK